MSMWSPQSKRGRRVNGGGEERDEVRERGKEGGARVDGKGSVAITIDHGCQEEMEGAA